MSAGTILLVIIIFQPILVAAGYDPMAFAVIGVLAIEAGLLPRRSGSSCTPSGWR